MLKSASDCAWNTEIFDCSLNEWVIHGRKNLSFFCSSDKTPMLVNIAAYQCRAHAGLECPIGLFILGIRIVRRDVERDAVRERVREILKMLEPQLGGS